MNTLQDDLDILCSKVITINKLNESVPQPAHHPNKTTQKK
jgi:hypothetical protein